LNIHSYTPDGRRAKAKKPWLTAQSQRRPGRSRLPERRMRVKQGQVTKFRCVRNRSADRGTSGRNFRGVGGKNRACGGTCARILYRSCEYANAQRSPLCSSGRTAIEVPGFEDHSHQLGSSPL